jgi:hypothetical protein
MQKHVAIVILIQSVTGNVGIIWLLKNYAMLAYG